MVLDQTQLQAVLTQHNVQPNFLDLLWRADGENVYGFTVHGSDALQYWNHLYQIRTITEHYPLLLGTPEEARYHKDSVEDNQPKTVAKILESGSALVAEEWFAKTADERRGDWEELSAEAELELPGENTLDQLTLGEIGEWNEGISPSDQYFTPYDILTKLPHTAVVVALIPTAFSWHVPAFLKLGSWNDCPASEEHVCLMHHWYEQHGAEVVGITNDVVEMRVANPPETREAAFRLAQEQYLYCADIVDQGVQTLNNLAATLMHGKTWFFWWD